MYRAESLLSAATLARLEDCFRRSLIEHARACKSLVPPKSVVNAGLALLRELAAAPNTRDPRGNPYLRLVRELPGVVGLESLDNLEGHGAHLLRTMRPVMVTVFAYGVPSEEILERIVERAGGGDILEIGAGGGYWARCLSDRGASVTAFDRVLPLDQLRPGGRIYQHHPVAVGGPAEALAASPNASLLLLCWPPGLINRDEAAAGAAPRFSSMGMEALDGFRGEQLVIVGDGGNSFGSPAFYQRVEREWHLGDRLRLPNLGSWRDEARVYRRR
ncbi:MAG TPA: hypothetical protein VGF45_13115 [Polyangia bacterium]